MIPLLGCVAGIMFARGGNYQNVTNCTALRRDRKNEGWMGWDNTKMSLKLDLNCFRFATPAEAIRGSNNLDLG